MTFSKFPSRIVGCLLLLSNTAVAFSPQQAKVEPPKSSPFGPAFPTPDTEPVEVLEAHLDALQQGDFQKAYHLLSRARKLHINEHARRDARESKPDPKRQQNSLLTFLQERNAEQLWESPCDFEEASCEIDLLSLVGDPAPPPGRIPKKLARVKLNTQHYYVTLTRQSDWDGKGDPRDCDGYERCWFVWDVQKDSGGGGGDDDEPVGSSGGGGGYAKKLALA